jgi:hypothetical protein
MTAFVLLAWAGEAALVVTSAAGCAPVSVAGRWLVCETSSGEHLLTLNLLEAGPSSVSGDVTMANGARSSASGQWLDDALSVSWGLVVQGGERIFSIVRATPTGEHALRGSYNDRYSFTTYAVDLVRAPIP